MYISDSYVMEFVKREGLSFLMCPKNRREFCNKLHQFIEDNGRYRKVVEKLVVDLMALFDNHIQTFHKTYKKLGATNITIPVQPLQVAVHLCQRYDLHEDDIVEGIIQRIVDYSSDGSCWYDFLSPFGNIRELHMNCLYPFSITRKRRDGSYTNEWITKAHLEAMEYYLQHGRRVTSTGCASLLGLQQDEVSLGDLPIRHRYFGYVTPLTLACLAGHPKAVHLLLRYGASPLFSSEVRVLDNLRSPWVHPLHALLNQLNMRLLDGEIEDLLYEDTSSPLHTTSERSSHVVRTRQKKLLVCLIYMLRALANPPVVLAAQVDTFSRSNSGVVFLKAVYAKWLEQPITEAPKLQHLCRSSIRESLRKNKELPRGIEKLPLPRSLKLYVDLM